MALNRFRPSRLRSVGRLGSTGRLAVVRTPLLLVALLVACADLRSPPPAGAAGENGTSGQGGASASAHGGAGQAGAGSTSSGGDAGLGGAASASNGTAGAGGHAEAGGTAAHSGASGQAGASGSAGNATACARRDGGDIQAWLYQEITTAQSNELHPFFALTNTGLSVPLRQLAIRYYFSGEMSGDWQLTCLWVTKAGGTAGGLCDEGVSLQIVNLDPPRPQADQYLEISFSGVSNEALSEGFPVEARTMFWRAGHPMLNQVNDYSFVPAPDPVLALEGRDYKRTSKVTVYRNGALVWGEEPCP